MSVDANVLDAAAAGPIFLSSAFDIFPQTLTAKKVLNTKQACKPWSYILKF